MATNTWSYSEAEKSPMRGDSTFVKIERGHLENLEESKRDAERVLLTLEKVESRCQLLQWRQTQSDKLINEEIYRENREMYRENREMYRENREKDTVIQNLKKAKRKLELESEEVARSQYFKEHRMSSVETKKQTRRKKRGQGRVNRRRCES